MKRKVFALRPSINDPANLIAAVELITYSHKVVETSPDIEVAGTLDPEVSNLIVSLNTLQHEADSLALFGVVTDCPYPVNQCKQVNPYCSFHENVTAMDWSQCHVCNPNDAPGHLCSAHASYEFGRNFHTAAEVAKSVDTVISTAAENEYITDLEQELAATEQIFTTVRLAYWKLKSKKITPELLRSWSKGGTLLGTERDNTCSFKLGDLADSINKFLEGK
jgi:hypothetical protein